MISGDDSQSYDYQYTAQVASCVALLSLMIITVLIFSTWCCLNTISVSISTWHWQYCDRWLCIILIYFHLCDVKSCEKQQHKGILIICYNNCNLNDSVWRFFLCDKSVYRHRKCLSINWYLQTSQIEHPYNNTQINKINVFLLDISIRSIISRHFWFRLG